MFLTTAAKRERERGREGILFHLQYKYHSFCVFLSEKTWWRTRNSQGWWLSFLLLSSPSFCSELSVFIEAFSPSGLVDFDYLSFYGGFSSCLLQKKERVFFIKNLWNLSFFESVFSFLDGASSCLISWFIACFISSKFRIFLPRVWWVWLLKILTLW